RRRAYSDQASLLPAPRRFLRGRHMTVQQSVLARFYDLLDGFADGDPVDHLADDFEFEMMFPGTADIPNERFSGDKEGFKQFLQSVAARGPRFQRSATERRHNIETLSQVDGLELMLGKGLGGRRNGTLL